MDDIDFGNGRIGSVKAAINMYGGGKINHFSTSMKKSLNDPSYPEKRTSSKAQELYLEKNRINRINENMKLTVSERSQTDFELLKAKKLVKELTSQIEESKLRGKEINKGRKSKVQPDQYEEVAREVEMVKRELSKLKLEIECIVEEKSRAEKEADAASLRLESYTRTAENLKRKIEEANEEEVFVELAEIQARKELAEIEAQRKREKEKISFMIEECRKKINYLKDEIQKTKDFEDTLDLTNSDTDLLQSEMNLNKELERVKKELEVVKRKGFHIMKSMDLIRNELIKISIEKGEIEKKEKEIEKGTKKLNSNLLKAKDKLEFARESEGKTRTTTSILSLALENLVKEKEAAMKEEDKLKQETKTIRDETRKIETETSTKEERLQTVLEVAKTAEENALRKLRVLAINVAKARASNTQSTITISKFEYDYLTGCAAGARELAVKKVAAAQAWTEALMAEQKEIVIKMTAAEKKITELTLKEEQEIRRTENSENATELTKEELQKRKRLGKLSLQERRSMRERNYSSTPGRQAKFRRSTGTPAARRMSSSTFLTVKRSRKVKLKSAVYSANEQIENDESVTSNGAED